MELAPLRQFQIVQHSLQEIEMRVVLDTALTADQETQIGDVLRESLGHPFAVKLRYRIESSCL